MSKYLFYAMTGEKSCLMHVLMNAVQLSQAGHEVRVIFEGRSVLLPAVFSSEQNLHYVKCQELGLLAGICYACSVQLKVEEQNAALGLPMLKDMFGHAGMLPYVTEGYQVISI